jgi:steroid 5-alpha reductase family enzyme
MSAAAVYYGLYRGDRTLGAVDVIGFALAMLATILELVADEQMKGFQKKSTDKEVSICMYDKL